MATKSDTTSKLNDMVVPSKTLESLFGLSPRTIRDLSDKGIVKRNSHGKYLLWSSVQGYITALKISNSVKAVAKMEDNEEEIDLETEKAAHERLKKQITEIKLQLIKGQVHKAEDVEAVMTDMLEKFKSKMTALPSKLAKMLEGKSRTEIQTILKREIDSALVELSSYTPADFYSDEHIDVSAYDAINALGVGERE